MHIDTILFSVGRSLKIIMGKQLSGRKRELNRHGKLSDHLDIRKKKKKCGTTNKNYRFNPTPLEEEHVDGAVSDGEVASEEEQVGEIIVYDNLLQILKGSCNKTIRHREEEGKSDTRSFELEEVEEGRTGVRTDSERSQLNDLGEPFESCKIDEEKEQLSDTGKEDDMQPPLSSRNFVKHLGHQLSQGDRDKLIGNKWTCNWKMPAIGMSNCKWIGTGECSLKEYNHGIRYGLKPRLYNHWLKIYNEGGGADFSSSTQSHFFSICNSYQDILHHNKKPFYLKGLEQDQGIADAYLMHALNDILNTKDLIKKNTEKLAKHENGESGGILNNDGFLDRGFTRPKVLIILPLRSIALRICKRLIKLTPLKNKAEHPNDIARGFARFHEIFGVKKDNDDRDDVENLKSKRVSKTSDWEALFGGNNDDNFAIGIKFSEKSIDFNKFDCADMIIASPLGLIIKIGEAEVMKEKNVDYLSSIEILIIDHADVILMQNWSHVDTIIKQLNCLPTELHDTDIMRIRPWYLNGQARYYRQTIILSSHINPDIHGTFLHQCVNYKGKVKLACEYKGVLSKVIPKVSQLYKRFDVDSYGDADDARFKYFTEEIFPQIKDSNQRGIMLFTSSYVEFVRLNKFLLGQDASYCSLGDYIENDKIPTERRLFFQGDKDILLYTERFHFHYRYKIRGIKKLIIYSLPERKEFYTEIVNMLEESQPCTVLYSQFDKLRLERIVGSVAARNMIAPGKKGPFVFKYD